MASIRLSVVIIFSMAFEPLTDCTLAMLSNFVKIS